MILYLLPLLSLPLPLPLPLDQLSGSVLLAKAHQHGNAISDITTTIELLKLKSITTGHGLENEIRSRREGEKGGGEERREEGAEEGGEEEEESDEEEEEITITIKDNRK